MSERAPIEHELELFRAEWDAPSPHMTVQTSGSTGTPKQMRVLKERMRASARLTCQYLGLKKGDTALLCMPLRYIAGKMVVVRALEWRLKLLVREPSGHPLAEPFDEALDFAAMIPLQVYNSLQVPAERERLTRIRHLIIGGGAIDRELAGSADYTNLTIGTTMSLEPIQANGRIIRVPTSNSGEYYLIENRIQTGWDAYIEGSGMIVYHVDRSQNIVDGITAAVRWTSNLINACASHECADLVEAFPNAGHISQVFFPGQAGITEFSAAGDPAFIAWDGTPTGFRLANIMHNGDNLTFDILEDVSEILLSPLSCHIRAYQNKAVLEWSPGRPGDYTWGIIWGEAIADAPVFQDTALISRFTFYKLQPKTDYYCSVYHIGRHSNGDTVSVMFSTQALTSPYPYIMLKRHYEAGDTLEMVVNNITEECRSVIWYVNGWRAISDRYVFRETGEYEIKAILEYASDGSKEYLVRRLTVTDAFIKDEEEE